MLWLWYRPQIGAPIQPLAQELPYATGVAIKGEKKKKLKIIGKEQTNLKMGKRPKQIPYQEVIQMASKHMIRCSTSYVTREIQIKTTTRYYHTYKKGQNPKH